MSKLIISVFVLFSSVAAVACDSHPGITHEQWTSAVEDERNKNGSVKTMSDSFFAPGPSAAQPGTSDGQRPIRTIGGN